MTKFVTIAREIDDRLDTMARMRPAVSSAVRRVKQGMQAVLIAGTTDRGRAGEGSQPMPQ